MRRLPAVLVGIVLAGSIGASIYRIAPAIRHWTPIAPCSSDGAVHVPRLIWEAAPADRRSDGWIVYDRPLVRTLHTVVVHHSAADGYEGPQEIQRQHMTRRGFADLGYHFVIDRHGCVYEGRDIDVQGAHVAGLNAGTIGVVLTGNFEESRPNRRQLSALKTLLGDLRRRYQVERLVGHRDLAGGRKTLCPGRHLEALLPELAQTGGFAARSAPVAR